MRTPLGPVRPRHRAVPNYGAAGREDVKEGGEVVLVRVARVAAELLEQRVEDPIRYDGVRQDPVQRKPLPPFQPLVRRDEGEEGGGVAAHAVAPRLVLEPHEADLGGKEVVVEHVEGKEGDAGLGEEHEAVVERVQEGVGEETALGVHDADVTPLDILEGGGEGGGRWRVTGIVNVQMKGTDGVVQHHNCVMQRREGILIGGEGRGFCSSAV